MRSVATKEQILAELKRRGVSEEELNKPQPQASSQSSQGDQLLNDLFQKAQPNSGVSPTRQYISDMLLVASGRKAPERKQGNELYADLLQTVLGQKAKHLFPEPISAKDQAETEKALAEAGLLKSFQSQAGGSMMPSAKVGGIEMVNPQAQNQILQDQERIKSMYPKAMNEADIARMENERAQTAMMNQFASQATGDNQGPLMAEATIGGIKMVNPQAKRRLDEMEGQSKLEQLKREAQFKGTPASEQGRISLAEESIKNIRDIKNTLFPGGDASSFRRDIATGSNLPGVSLPFLGRVTPQVRPDNPFTSTDDEATRQAQDVFRKMGTSLSGRQLIQTGVAARPEETEKLVAQFAPNMQSNPAAALAALNELENFYSSFLTGVKPQAAVSEYSGSQYSLGQIIDTPRGKARIVGLSDPNDPDIEFLPDEGTL